MRLSESRVIRTLIRARTAEAVGAAGAASPLRPAICHSSSCSASGCCAAASGEAGGRLAAGGGLAAGGLRTKRLRVAMHGAFH